MKNSIQRRPHRERAQPHERTKWGILEKPKDYKLRAADHKVKKRKLKTLQQKARERNEDEFYFAMVNEKSRDGIRVKDRPDSKVLSAEAVKLMKTQDVGYLRAVLQQTRRERGRVEEEVTTMRVSGEALRPDVVKERKNRIAFDDEGEEMRHTRPRKTDDLSKSEDDDAGQENDTTEAAFDTEDPKARALNKKRRKLEVLKDRERDLAAALEEVEDQRARINGSIGGRSKAGVAFKVRRKK